MNPYISLFLAGMIGMCCAFIAKKKSRNPYIWFFLGFFFTIFSLLIVLLLPSKNQKVPSEADLRVNAEQASELEKTETITPFIDDEKLWYYLDQENHQCGPITLEALKRKWDEGKVKNTTFVWNENLTEWKALQDTSDFQQYFQKEV